MPTISCLVRRASSFYTERNFKKLLIGVLVKAGTRMKACIGFVAWNGFNPRRDVTNLYKILIDLKPLVYCASKLIENFKLFYKSNRPHFLWVYRRDNPQAFSIKDNSEDPNHVEHVSNLHEKIWLIYFNVAWFTHYKISPY